MQRTAVFLGCLVGLGGASQVNKAELSSPNPIRKVVTLLEAMQKKVEEEGKTEKALYDKFLCYCKTGTNDLTSSIEAANTAIPSLASDIKSGEEQSVQLKGELKQAQVDRDAAKKAIAEATAIREKQAAAYAAERADYETNIAAMGKAIAALSKGAGGSFLQTTSAKVLQKLVFSKADMLDADRQELAAFLAGEADYAPASGQITGILKGLKDSAEASLTQLIATEEAAIKSFNELVAAKKQEIEALSNAIETKTQRVGDLGVQIAQWNNDLSSTQKALIKDQEFLDNLKSSCATKEAEAKEREETRSQELVALAETIKLLNDDDALDLFKKTLPSAASFMQLQASSAAVRAQALTLLRDAQQNSGHASLLLDRLVLVLQGKKIGFEKVVSMIDGMVQLLKKEQQDDEHKKEYCDTQFDIAEDKQKALELTISDTEKVIDMTEEGISKVTEEIAALQAGLKALDKSVADATAQRKAENADYNELLSSNNAAKDLLGLARNRLNKFYNPKLYKPEAASLVQISMHVQGKADPGPAPEVPQGSYAKKSEESTGVIAMIDMLIADLDKELQQAGVDEKKAQQDYEKLMVDSGAKRSADSKLLTEKESLKATLEGQLQAQKDNHASAVKELGGVHGYIASLHGECDWLLQYYDARKTAREGEAESLEKAKAVLSGASYSLVQTSRRGALRGAH